MSHREGMPSDDQFYMDPKEVLSQYSVEWVSLRKSYTELKQKLDEIQAELNTFDRKLETKSISEREHIQLYQQKWAESTQLIQVKREVESRLYEIQKEIRAANKQLKQMEIERERRERIEQEKSHAMIEWMSLKQGFDLVNARRAEINAESDRIELERRSGKISEEKYRESRINQIRQLAELRTVESDVKRRLAELLEIIRG
jgi:chromosome segregation ATPase